MVFGLDVSHSVRFGHFDYLKEDSDDEHKRLTPSEQLCTEQLIETVTLADKLACEKEVMDVKREERYRKNNSPHVRYCVTKE